MTRCAPIAKDGGATAAIGDPRWSLPIFQEPPPDIDETWTHGAMLGGMVGYDNESLAHEYFLAGEVLVTHVLSTGERGRGIRGLGATFGWDPEGLMATGKLLGGPP